MSQAKDVAKSAAKNAAKSVAKNAVKKAVKNSANSTAEIQLLGIYHDCFHLGLGTLLAARCLDPFLRRSGSVSSSLSPQCNLWSNVKRLSALKDLIHPILGATLTEQALTMTCGRFVAGLYGKYLRGLSPCPSKSTG